MHSCLISLSTELHKLLYSSNDVEYYIELLQQSCHEQQQESAKTILSFVISLLDRIISRPDDIQARKLRITHPTIWAKLAGRRGGIQLLAALGFQLQVKPTIQENLDDVVDDSQQHLRSKEGLLLAHLSRITTALHGLEALVQACTGAVLDADLSMIAELLAPHSQWVGFLEMQEPDLTEGGSASLAGSKQSWLQWFDGLKQHRDLIRGFL